MEKYKTLKKGAFKKAAEIFESGRKKAPSDRLVKIISEIPTQEETDTSSKQNKKIAKDAEV